MCFYSESLIDVTWIVFLLLILSIKMDTISIWFRLTQKIYNVFFCWSLYSLSKLLRRLDENNFRIIFHSIFIGWKVIDFPSDIKLIKIRPKYGFVFKNQRYNQGPIKFKTFTKKIRFNRYLMTVIKDLWRSILQNFTFS